MARNGGERRRNPFGGGSGRSSSGSWGGSGRSAVWGSRGRRGAFARRSPGGWGSPGGYGRRPGERRLLPTSLPQTLQFAVYLLYWNALLGLLFGLLAGGAGLVYLALVAADAAGGYGVANERKWGYVVAIVAAFLPFAFLFIVGGVVAGGILNLIFEIALVVLLLHPMSRSYFKTYFR